VRLSAKGDYACRAMAELARGEGPTKAERVATAQHIPPKFLENILLELKHAGLVESQRGLDGGYWLARDPASITLADIVRAVEGPLANVRGQRPEALQYVPAAEALRDVWIAVRANVRAVLERVTLAHILTGSLPDDVQALARDPDAWLPH
jgi:Rrf2 family protein